VIVLDEKTVAGGESGRTSAHLSSAIDDRFRHIEHKHGLANARLLYESHARAIDEIERIVREEAIECEFQRIDGFLFAGEGQARQELEAEYEAARRCGVEGVELLERPPASGVVARPCIRFAGQARFHPLLYLEGLAGAIERLGGTIALGSRVVDLAGDGPVTARLDTGASVEAGAGIAATNVPSPINNWMGLYLKQAAYRSYVVGLEAPEGVADALYWDMADPYHYVRLESLEGRPVLLVGGEDHKTGQPGEHPGQERFERLARWAQSWFPGTGAVVARWSGQVNEPDDGIAFIGRVPTRDHKACHVITGDSGMGLTHGTLGAMLVRDLVLGHENPWAEIYDPARRPWQAPGEFVRENLNAAGQLADYVTGGDEASTDSIAPGCGAVVREGLTKIAAYRDGSGLLHRRSAICPHLKCVVRWNDTEKSWDCPCHGSRFDAQGKLIIGPAIDDLPPA
jgi:glycine/D-amino acid oxidase-like deaminating enzyme/nitrite reductase/ring-hydroxylating ferredoxin subunit